MKTVQTTLLNFWPVMVQTKLTDFWPVLDIAFESLRASHQIDAWLELPSWFNS
jgi:hypothetical protein